MQQLAPQLLQVSFLSSENWIPLFPDAFSLTQSFFRCSECKRQLSSTYYARGKTLYCKKDYTEKFRSKCHVCEQKISGLVVVCVIIYRVTFNSCCYLSLLNWVLIWYCFCGFNYFVNHSSTARTLLAIVFFVVEGRIFHLSFIHWSNSFHRNLSLLFGIFLNLPI